MASFFAEERKNGNGHWDTDRYQKLDVSGLADKVFEHLKQAECLQEQESFRILNLGSGDGVNIVKFAKERKKYLPNVDKPIEVVGIDYSPDMVAAAQKRLLGELKGVEDFRATTIQGDASAVRFSENSDVREGSFDAVVSVSAFHWVKNQQGIVDSMAKALKPGGIMAVEFAWRSPVIIEQTINKLLNERGIVPSEDRWHRTDKATWEDMLNRGGFDTPSVAVVSRNQQLAGPDGMAEWLQTFIKGVDNFIGNVADKDTFLGDVVTALKDTALYDRDSDRWHVTYERLSVQATRSIERAVGTDVTDSSSQACCNPKMCVVL